MTAAAVQGLGVHLTPVAYSSRLIDAAGEKVAMQVNVPKTGNIAKFIVRCGTVTTSETLKGSIQLIDSSGNPDGSIIQSGTVASPASNTWLTFTLGAVYAATRGQRLAFVVEFDSTVGNLNINSGSGHPLDSSFCNHYTTSWAHQLRAAIVFIEYDDGSYGYMPLMGSGDNSRIDYHVDTGTYDEYALRFKVAVPCNIGGAIACLRNPPATDIVLYSGTTALATASVTPLDYGANLSLQLVHFATPYAIDANTEYRLAVKPTTTTVVGLYMDTYPSVATMNQNAGGTEWYLSKRLNAGAWTDTTTILPFIYPQFTAFDDGAGGGGGLAANPVRGFVS